MRKILLSFIFLINLSLVVSAQEHKTDSLYSVLKTAKEDTNKVKTLNALSWECCIKGHFATADSLAKKALQLDSVLGYKAGMIKSVKTIGSIYYMQDNYSGALKSYYQCLKLDKEIDNKSDMANVYANIGIIFYSQGNYPEALKNYLQSLKISEDLGNKKLIGGMHGNIGIIYYSQGNYSDALKSYLQAIKILEELNDKEGLANIYGNLGNVYEAQKDYANAINAQEKSLKIYQEVGYGRGVGAAYENIGNVHFDEGKYSEALNAFRQAIEILGKSDYKRGLGYAYQGVGDVYLKQKSYSPARQYLDSALHMAQSIGEKEIARNAYHSRAILDSATSDYKSALSDYKNYIMYGDSLKNEENVKKMVSEQMQYDFDKKQAEEKAEQDKKDAIANADRRKQYVITAAISIGLLLVIIFSGLLFSRFRITQKQKETIEEQKVLVEVKNKEVLDSITYAKRLQDAILPPISIIKKYFPESFVLYKPKDIVAGDFYWMEYIPTQALPSGGEGKSIPPREGGIQGGIVLIAACDCTGHGVPGAMVSVVCSNALNRTVKEFKITEPGKILDKVRELVIETFEKSESDVKDGMDISLASLTPSQGGITLKWAGAYNSLWYLENGEMKEITADKQPIGKSDNVTPFTTHTLTISTHSGGQRRALYLFTDGYADQFGGPKGKKFKYKQLQELLVANSNQPMTQQKEMLEQTLENWKGSLEQVDDVLIMGIRI